MYFSGFDPETGTYDRSTWMYEGGEVASAAGMREHATQAFDEQHRRRLLEGPDPPRSDVAARALRVSAVA